MKICFFNAVYDSTLRSIDELLSTYWHIPALAEAIACRGNDVLIAQAFSDSAASKCGPVELQTIRAHRATSAGNSETMEVSDYDFAFTMMDRFSADIVHLFGLRMPRPLKLLGSWARQNDTALTASFHGGLPPRNPLARLQQKRSLKDVSALFFSAPQYAEKWFRSGVIGGETAVTIAPEVSSPFQGLDRNAARQQMNLTGNPVVAWSGRLHAIKDPLTTLTGFERIAKKVPDVELLMSFATSELLDSVQAYLRSNTQLNERVRLLGRLDHEEMEVLFSAADIFVASSIREYGSNSLMEAMSCGAVPLLTDIPTFRYLTRKVDAAQLYQCGDVDELVDAFDRIMCQDLSSLSCQVKNAFSQHLSYAALARQYCRVFEGL